MMSKKPRPSVSQPPINEDATAPGAFPSNETGGAKEGRKLKRVKSTSDEPLRVSTTRVEEPPRISGVQPPRQSTTPGAAHSVSRNPREQYKRRKASRMVPKPASEPPMQTRAPGAFNGSSGSASHQGKAHGKMKKVSSSTDAIHRELAPEPTELVGSGDHHVSPKSRAHSLPASRQDSKSPTPSRTSLPDKLLPRNARVPPHKKIQRGLSREKLPTRAAPQSLLEPPERPPRRGLRRGRSRGDNQPETRKRVSKADKPTSVPRSNTRDSVQEQTKGGSRRNGPPATRAPPHPSTSHGRNNLAPGQGKRHEERKVEEEFEDEMLKEDTSSPLLSDDFDGDNHQDGSSNAPAVSSDPQLERAHLVEATLVEDYEMMQRDHPFLNEDSTIGTSVVVEAQKAQLSDFLQNRRLQCFILLLVVVIVVAVVVAQLAITRLGGNSSGPSESSAPKSTIAPTPSPTTLRPTQSGPTLRPSKQHSNIFDDSTSSPTIAATSLPSPESEVATKTTIPTANPSTSTTSPNDAPAVFPTTIPTTAPTTSSPTVQPSIAPTLKPSISLVFPDDLPAYTKLPLASSASSQGKALDWVENHPNYDLLPEWKKFELFALVSFYYSLSRGEEWPDVFAETGESWLDYSVPDCDWGDLQCTSSGSVQNLHFIGEQQDEVGSDGLKGTVPAEIELLSSLTSIKLHRFYGHQDAKVLVPEEVANLAELTELSIMHSFDGTLPGAVLGQLKNLESLVLQTFGHTPGPIPSEILHLSSLEALILAEEMTGQLPSQLGMFSSLTLLQLGRGISGAFPTEIGLMSSLELLWLYFNQLTGSLVTEFGSLSKLKQILAEGNALTGFIPSEVGKMTRMQVLNLRNNQLIGQIPTQLGLFPEIFQIKLSQNNLNGTIPSELHNLRPQWDISLNDNRLSGSIPSELGLMQRGQTLDFSNNELAGLIPSQLGRLTFLEKLKLGGNDLVGIIPSELCRLAEVGVIVEVDCDKVTCPVGCGCDCVRGSERPLLLDKEALVVAVEEWTANASSSYGPISEWDVSAISNFDDLFSDKAAFNDDINNWSTSQVTSMQRTFQGANAFNQPLDMWDTTLVASMELMFANATEFNQDISMWQVGSVTSFGSMFKYAEKFQADLCSWNGELRQDAIFKDAFIGTDCPVEADPTLDGIAFSSLCHECQVFNSTE